MKRTKTTFAVLLFSAGALWLAQSAVSFAAEPATLESLTLQFNKALQMQDGPASEAALADLAARYPGPANPLAAKMELELGRMLAFGITPDVPGAMRHLEKFLPGREYGLDDLAADGLIEYAQTLIKTGRHDEARAIFAGLLGHKRPKHVVNAARHIAALDGLLGRRDEAMDARCLAALEEKRRVFDQADCPYLQWERLWNEDILAMFRDMRSDRLDADSYYARGLYFHEMVEIAAWLRVFEPTWMPNRAAAYQQFERAIWLMPSLLDPALSDRDLLRHMKARVSMGCDAPHLGDLSNARRVAQEVLSRKDDLIRLGRNKSVQDAFSVLTYCDMAQPVKAPEEIEASIFDFLKSPGGQTNEMFTQPSLQWSLLTSSRLAARRGDPDAQYLYLRDELQVLPATTDTALRFDVRTAETAFHLKEHLRRHPDAPERLRDHYSPAYWMLFGDPE